MAMKKPNVLLIVIDQLRADMLHGRLSEAARLRNLAALAEEACVFERHYTVVTPCGPSRVSLFTGQYAMNHRAVRNGTPLRHDTPNLAREMRAAGYEPLLFGYTDVAQDPRVLEPEDPRLRSYEEVLPGFAEALRMRQETDDEAWRDHLRGRGVAVPDGMALYVPDGDHIAAPACYAAEDSDTAFLTNRFLERMEREGSGWFAALTYIRPHPPFVAPAPYNTIYDPDALPAPEVGSGKPVHPFLEALRDTRRAASVVEGFPDLPEDAATVRQLRALYFGLAAEVDHHVGRVVRWLKETGRWDDTILILTSDHGEMLGDHGVWGKGSYHDASFHVPLLIRVPGHAPRRIEGMTESVDVMPTVLELVDHPVPHSVNGVSLVPALKEGKGGKMTTFSEIDFGDPVAPTALQRLLGLSAPESNLAVLRTSRHKLVHFASDLPQVLCELTGASEGPDISAMPNSRAICLDLSRQMLCHRMSHPESTFARTMVVDGGVKTGPA